MAIKLKGIVAYPGKHRDEVVTADMLKKAIQYQNRIPIIIGPHPPGGYSKPSDWVGTTSTVWNEEKQRVDGEFWLFDEDYDRLPDEVKRKIANREEIRLSACYETDVVDGVQKWRKWDHLALGVPNPAIEGVGVNVRMESEFPKGLRAESEPVIAGEEKKKESVELTKAELKAIVDTAVAEAVQKVAAEVTPPEEEEKTEKAPEAQEAARPAPEPEMVLPASAPKSKKADDGIETTEDGWWKF